VRCGGVRNIGDIAGQGILVAGMGSRVGSRVCSMDGS